MADRKNIRADRYLRQEQWRNRLAAVTVSLGGGKVRLLVATLALGFCVWQLYAFAWLPLLQAASLPQGLAAVSAQLDTATLVKIQDARSQRLTEPLNQFSQADQYFGLTGGAPVP